MLENSSTSSDLLLHHCTNIYTACLSVRAIILLPVSIFILFLALQRWWRQHSFKSESHMDIFTYHFAVNELVSVSGCLWMLCVSSTSVVRSSLGMCLTMIGLYGEMLFYTLTCVERYVAVVHPVSYLRLRNARGVRIRNSSIGCVWLLSFVLTSPHVVTDQYSTFIMWSLLVLTIVVTSVCSLYVLHVLVRPGPGEGGREKEPADQSKQRAFHIITAISSVQWFWFLGLLVSVVNDKFSLLSPGVSCVVKVSLGFCNPPSSLVLPLLYLQKAGKLKCSCSKNAFIGKVHH